MSEHDTPAPSVPQEPQHEKVYILKIQVPSAEAFYKIGRSHDIAARIGELQVANPFEIVLLHQIATNDANWLERHLHRQYRKDWVRGEWFALSSSDAADICQIGRFDRQAIALPPEQSKPPAPPKPPKGRRKGYGGRKENWPPQLIAHKPSGCGRLLLRIGGRPVGIYLGKFGSELIQRQYEDLVRHLTERGWPDANAAARQVIFDRLPRHLLRGRYADSRFESIPPT